MGVEFGAALRDVERHPLREGVVPPWATAWGQDRFGVFAGFEVGGVASRLRWIPGGVWRVGSPKEEAGRFDDEALQTVALRGFWLGEFPCTQELFEAVMEENPSRFRHPLRPVERVSWGDAVRMIRRLNERVPGLSVRLPFEAEWEVACRAGTEWATYAGDLEILGANHAPVLDRIAWYGGNSGVGYELEEGESSSDWPEKQFAHVKAGTRVVGTKQANPWGLYDMLGNVYEWCADEFHGELQVPSMEDQMGACTETAIEPRGADRVLRGGGWCWRARRCRAAGRGADPPGDRGGWIGFRLSRGQDS